MLIWRPSEDARVGREVGDRSPPWGPGHSAAKAGLSAWCERLARAGGRPINGTPVSACRSYTSRGATAIRNTESGTLRADTPLKVTVAEIMFAFTGVGSRPVLVQKAR